MPSVMGAKVRGMEKNGAAGPEAIWPAPSNIRTVTGDPSASRALPSAEAQVAAVNKPVGKVPQAESGGGTALHDPPH